MVIFLGNLPFRTTEQDLARLGRLPGGQAYVRIFKKRRVNGDVTRFGLLQVPSDTLGRKTLSRLQHARLEGRPIVAREYERRAAGNERRSPNWRDRGWSAAERRQAERRCAG